jgi:hypothetical protein
MVLTYANQFLISASDFSVDASDLLGCVVGGDTKAEEKSHGKCKERSVFVSMALIKGKRFLSSFTIAIPH